MPRVELSAQARLDVFAIYAAIEAEAGSARANAYIGRVERRLSILAEFQLAGAAAAWIGPGIRSLAFERRITIAYLPGLDSVQVPRVLYADRTP